MWRALEAGDDPLDMSDLARTFVRKPPAAARKKSARTEQRKPGGVLSGRRAHLFALELAGFKRHVDFEPVADAVRALDVDDALEARELEALLKLLPTADERRKLAALEAEMKRHDDAALAAVTSAADAAAAAAAAEAGAAAGVVAAAVEEGPRQRLERPERFLLCMARVPQLAERLRTALTMKAWASDKTRVGAQLRRVEEAATQVRGSTALRAFLGICLRVGNRLNGQSAHGNASGFSVGSLEQLWAIKSSCGRETLLQHVLARLHVWAPDAVGLPRQLTTLRAAGREALGPIDEALGELRGSVAALDAYLARLPPPAPPPALVGGTPAVLHATPTEALVLLRPNVHPATLHWGVGPRWRQHETISRRGHEQPPPSAEAVRVAAARLGGSGSAGSGGGGGTGTGGGGGGGSAGGGGRGALQEAGRLSVAAPGEAVLLRLSGLATGTEHVLHCVVEDTLLQPPRPPPRPTWTTPPRLAKVRPAGGTDENLPNMAHDDDAATAKPPASEPTAALEVAAPVLPASEAVGEVCSVALQTKPREADAAPDDEPALPIEAVAERVEQQLRDDAAAAAAKAGVDELTPVLARRVHLRLLEFAAGAAREMEELDEARERTHRALEAAAAYLGEPSATAEEAHRMLGQLQALVTAVQEELNRLEVQQPAAPPSSTTGQASTAKPPKLARRASCAV